jgi:hypothetical protein
MACEAFLTILCAAATVVEGRGKFESILAERTSTPWTWLGRLQVLKGNLRGIDNH